MLLLVGIVLRGAAFTFRAYDRRTTACRPAGGWLFSSASALAPLLLGAVVVGALASGTAARRRAWLRAARRWLAPFPLVGRALRPARSSPTWLRPTSRSRPRGRCVTTSGAGRWPPAWPRLRRAARRRRSPARAGAARLRGPDRPAAGRWPLVTSPPRRPRSPRCRPVRRPRPARARRRRRRRWRSSCAGWGALAAPVPSGARPDPRRRRAHPAACRSRCCGRSAPGAVFLFPALYLLFRVFKGERPFSVIDRKDG